MLRRAVTSLASMPRLQWKSPEARQQAREYVAQVFHDLDVDGSGALEIDEVRNALPRLGMLPEQAELAFYLYDIDRSGTLQLPEFWKFIVEVSNADVHPRSFLKRAFKAFDADNNGVLDQQEIETYFTIAGLENPVELARELSEHFQRQPVTFKQLYRFFYPR
jgi:Ca2+-binding EF-hand superfamily protein